MTLFKSDLFSVTPLVAYGGVFLFTIFGCFGLARLSESAKSKQDKVINSANELAVLHTLEDTKLWQSRLDESLALKQARANTVWTDATYSLLAARIQSTLRRIGDASGLDNLNIAVDPEVSKIGDTELIRFTLSSNGSEAQNLLKFMYALTTYPVTINSDDLTLSFNPGGRSNLRLSGHAPVLLRASVERQP